MKQKITTKKGDQGKTNLYKGKIVDKDDLRVEILGSLDELNSFLGLIKVYKEDQKGKQIIESIQKDLLLIGREIDKKTTCPKDLKENFGKEKIEKIEKLITDYSQRVNLKKEFYLPGQNLKAVYLDIARAAARRTERRIVSLKKKHSLENPHILIYLNRLSDLLFLLARDSGNCR